MAQFVSGVYRELSLMLLALKAAFRPHWIQRVSHPCCMSKRRAPDSQCLFNASMRANVFLHPSHVKGRMLRCKFSCRLQSC
jgi:hypothetical protein